LAVRQQRPETASAAVLSPVTATTKRAASALRPSLIKLHEMIRALIILGLLCRCLVAQSAEPAGVLFSETSYDFGMVKQGSKVVHGFPVKNRTTTPVTIKSVQLSIPGMSARFRPAIVPDGEGAITLEWDTSHLSGDMVGEAIVLFADSRERTETLLLKGVVRPALEILPYPAIFLSSFRGEDNECRLKIVNNTEEPTAISLPATGSKHFIASLTTIEPGRVYELVAKIPSAAAPGRYDDELPLSTHNPKLPDITIPVHVFVKPDLYANPEAIDFGVVSAEELRKNPATRELLTQTFLMKRRKGEFEIKKIASDLEVLEVRKDPPVGKSSTYRIDVRLNPQEIKAGKLAGSIEIETDDKEFPLITVPVTGRVF
jgi:hypothetical protein